MECLLGTRTPKGAVVPVVAGDKPEDAYGIRDEGWSGEIGCHGAPQASGGSDGD